MFSRCCRINKCRKRFMSSIYNYLIVRTSRKVRYTSHALCDILCFLNTTQHGNIWIHSVVSYVSCTLHKVDTIHFFVPTKPSMHIPPRFTLYSFTMFVLNVPFTIISRIKYSISIVADKGLKKHLYTSARLKKGEVLYLETHSCRYVKSHPWCFSYLWLS